MSEAVNNIGGAPIKPDWDMLIAKQEEEPKSGYMNNLMNNLGNMLNGSFAVPSDTVAGFQG